ncbi:hypothetical protein FJ251_04850 [bacterium]|nr:hypothetical protein [bacterium]
MVGKAKARGLLLAIGLALASAAAADEAPPFRRWGLGWGELLSVDDYSYLRGVGLRYRLASGWSFTATGSFATASSSGYYLDENPDYYTFDQGETVTSSDPVSRSFGFSCARGFALHPRLGLAPVLRIVHSYSRRVEERENLDLETDGNDWEYDVSRSQKRGETLRLGVGLRPQIQLHSRVSVESQVFFDYYRSHSREQDWHRGETSEGESGERTSRGTRKESGWYWSVPTPSVTMGLTLFFYF